MFSRNKSFLISINRCNYLDTPDDHLKLAITEVAFDSTIDEWMDFELIIFNSCELDENKFLTRPRTSSFTSLLNFNNQFSYGLFRIWSCGPF